MLDKLSLLLTGLVLMLGGLWYAADRFLDAPRTTEDGAVITDTAKAGSQLTLAEAVSASVKAHARETTLEAVADAKAQVVKPVLQAKAEAKIVEAKADETVEAKPAKPTSIDDILARMDN